MATDIDREKLRSLVDIYKRNVERELGAKISQPNKFSSLEYQEFKKQYMPKHLGLYEKFCNLSETILKIGPDKKKIQLIQENINISHLNVTPIGVTSLSYLAPILIILFGSLISFALIQSTFFIIFSFIVGLALIRPLAKFPEYAANNWRLKASNQMVLCIFYVVTYMRHTSNLENAVDFASEHLAPPLSLDLKKVIWDVETEKHASLKESLDAYLESWKKWNLEFIEAFHLIEASLYEGAESRRLNSLDKSLDVILDETYEKMLHYAHNLQSPITMLHMLGIILPILGLVILPLVVSFMDNVRWYHISILYNVTLPITVYFMGKSILSQRPTGYGENDISENNPELKKYKNVLINLGGIEIKFNPLIISITLGIFFLFIGFSPIIFHSLGIVDFGVGGEDLTSPCAKKFCFLGYRESQTTGEEIGPYGLGAALIGLATTLAFGLSIGLYYRLRSKNIIKIRNRSKKLELEFAGALFQLGNRLGDGLPAEIAFGKVSSVMRGTVSGSFFQLVSINIRRLGMSVSRAIFDPMYGALVKFPSNLIESSMKILIQSLKKGPTIAAQALSNVSRYIKEIHKVNERLKDLMAEIMASMTSQIKFLTPAIAGIVIGITSMVTTILGKLGQQLSSVTTGGGADGANIGAMQLFGDGIPTYHFQLIVGLYVVQITYILTILSNGIENGSDKLMEKYSIGQNMVRSTILYCIIAAIVMLLFNLIAASILSSTLAV